MFHFTTYFALSICYLLFYWGFGVEFFLYVFFIVVLTQTRYGAAVSVSQMKTVNRIQVRSLGVSDSFS